MVEPCIGAADTWGRTWIATDLANANFRVRVIDLARLLAGLGRRASQLSVET
jgi:hypothetical protein